MDHPATVSITFLSSTPITDFDLVEIKQFTNLQELWLDGTKVTERGVQELHEAPPNSKIVR